MPASKSATRKPTRPAPSAKKAKGAPKAAPAARLTLAEVLRLLEQAGSAQTRKTYARHGANENMFGVSFATLGALRKKIGVDHELAMQLWDTGNFDARNLAFKIVDPARMTPPDLDRWARDTIVRMCAGYISMLAAEGPHALAMAKRWLAAKDEHLRCAGWGLVGQLAAREPALPDAWLAEHVAQIERTLQSAPNWERYAMNGALIAIGGRSAALHKATLAAARRIGKVEVDHGDTSCKTPEVAAYLAKMWEHAKAKGFASPSAQEQERETPRTRC
jgi:3-methyladenine DNA glycosylase AlkD